MEWERKVRGKREIKKKMEAFQQHFKSSGSAEGETVQSSYTDLNCTETLAKKKRTIRPLLHLVSKGIENMDNCPPHI